jgi:hypothetical protein
MRRAFNAEMDAIDVSPFIRSFAERKKAFQSVATRFAKHMAHNRRLVREIDRHCAERILLICPSAPNPIQSCRDTYRRISSLGFSSLDRRVAITLVYLRYLAELGQHEAAKEIAGEVRNGLQRARRNPKYVRFLKVSKREIERLLKEFGA